VPDPTGRGRFDLPARLSPVLYLAESPEHAVAEVLHSWRGRRIGARHLRRAGHVLASVHVRWASREAGVADLCDPDALAALAIPPDRIASRHRSVTQPIAQAVWDTGHAGLRWWSRFWGDWHTTVAFTARGPGGRAPASQASQLFDEPEPLTLESPALLEAARLLGIEVRG
jgi:hypothetical protein